MGSPLNVGQLLNLLRIKKKLTIVSGGQLVVEAGASIANAGALSSTGTIVAPVINLIPATLPATCGVGDVAVQITTNKLNICTAANTWTVVGTQT